MALIRFLLVVILAASALLSVSVPERGFVVLIREEVGQQGVPTVTELWRVSVPERGFVALIPLATIGKLHICAA